MTNTRSGDALAVYVFLAATAEIQGRSAVRATTTYIARGLRWGEDRVNKAKAALVALGLVERVAQRGRGNRIVGHFLRVRYLAHLPDGSSRRGDFQALETPGTGNSGTMVGVDERSPLAKKNEKGETRVPAADDFVFQPEFESVRRLFVLEAERRRWRADWAWEQAERWYDRMKATGWKIRGKPIRQWWKVATGWCERLDADTDKLSMKNARARAEAEKRDRERAEVEHAQFLEQCRRDQAARLEQMRKRAEANRQAKKVHQEQGCADDDWPTYDNDEPSS